MMKLKKIDVAAIEIAVHGCSSKRSLFAVNVLLSQVILSVLLLTAGVSVLAQSRSNVFNDPFLQATSGLPNCPVPEPPGYTEQEARDIAHVRSQRGVSCWLAGQCRLSNAYLYDAEIIQRVQKAFRADGRFGNSSIWAAGAGRWVTLQGCVSTAQQAADAERMVRLIDDVSGVFNELMVGTDGKPRYRVMPQ